MRLAEALILRADYQKRIEQLKNRLLRNAKTQEGDDPAENPTILLAEMERIAQELARLIQRINKTNAVTLLQDEMTIADAIAVRDVLRVRHTIYTGLAQAATVTQDRYTKSEVKFRSAIDVAAIQKQADGIAQEHRELDTLIQEANWKTELLA
jgi:glutathione S-transferase